MYLWKFVLVWSGLVLELVKKVLLILISCILKSKCCCLKEEDKEMMKNEDTNIYMKHIYIYPMDLAVLRH